MKTRRPIQATLVFAALVLLLSSTPVHGLTMLLTVDSPSECPVGLTVKSTAHNGMIDFDITVDADAIANNPSYRGRTGARAFLVLMTAAGQPMARVPLQETAAGTSMRYQFSLAPSAAQTAEVQVSVSLFEKDGRATVGGGVSLRIQLAKFAPAAPAPAAPAR